MSEQEMVGEQCDVFPITIPRVRGSDAYFQTGRLLHLGQYDGEGNYVEHGWRSIKKHPERAREIEFVRLDELDHDPATEEILQEFKKRGLERPTYEDALVFGIQHPDEQRKHSVVFLHDPIQTKYGAGLVAGYFIILYSSGDEGQKRFISTVLSSELTWSRNYVFAAVRPYIEA